MLLMVVGCRVVQVGGRPLYKPVDTGRREQTDNDSTGVLSDRSTEKKNTYRSRHRAGTGCCVGLMHSGVRNLNEVDRDRPLVYGAD